MRTFAVGAASVLGESAASKPRELRKEISCRTHELIYALSPSGLRAPSGGSAPSAIGIVSVQTGTRSFNGFKLTSKMGRVRRKAKSFARGVTRRRSCSTHAPRVDPGGLAVGEIHAVPALWVARLARVLVLVRAALRATRRRCPRVHARRFAQRHLHLLPAGAGKDPRLRAGVQLRRVYARQRFPPGGPHLSRLEGNRAGGGVNLVSLLSGRCAKRSSLECTTKNICDDAF